MAVTNDGTTVNNSIERIQDQELWKEEDVLRTYYWKFEYSIGDIADELGDKDVDYNNVWYWMDRHGIPRRGPGGTGDSQTNGDGTNRNHHGHVTPAIDSASEIVGTDVTDLSQRELAEVFLEYDDELLIRLSNGSGCNAYFIGRDGDVYHLYRVSTTPTEVDLTSEYVQSMFDTYDATLVDRDMVQH